MSAGASSTATRWSSRPTLNRSQRRIFAVLVSRRAARGRFSHLGRDFSSKNGRRSLEPNSIRCPTSHECRLAKRWVVPVNDGLRSAGSFRINQRVKNNPMARGGSPALLFQADPAPGRRGCGEMIAHPVSQRARTEVAPGSSKGISRVVPEVAGASSPDQKLGAARVTPFCARCPSASPTSTAVPGDGGRFGASSYAEGRPQLDRLQVDLGARPFASAPPILLGADECEEVAGRPSGHVRRRRPCRLRRRKYSTTSHLGARLLRRRIAAWATFLHQRR